MFETTVVNAPKSFSWDLNACPGDGEVDLECGFFDVVKGDQSDEWSHVLFYVYHKVPYAKRELLRQRMVAEMQYRGWDKATIFSLNPFPFFCSGLFTEFIGTAAEFEQCDHQRTYTFGPFNVYHVTLR